MMAEVADQRAAVEASVLSQAPETTALWNRVIELAEEAHAGQFRNNGRPYLAHVLDVAMILVEWQVAPRIVLAGVLHDAVRYGHFETVDELPERLQDEELISILSVADRMSHHDTIIHYVRDNSRLQNIFELMVGEVRALLVRCANRLANLRDADAFKGDQRTGLLLNSHEVYLPLLERMGMWRVRAEMEDCLFALREPERYAAVQQWQRQQWEEQASDIEAWKARVEAALDRRGLGPSYATVEVEALPPAAIFRRYASGRSRSIDDLDQLDNRYLFLTRVLTRTLDDAYRALGAVHECGSPGSAAFRDYLAQPKTSGYASLHTSVVLNSVPHRIRIFTDTLYRLARNGILLPEAYACWCEADPPPDWHPVEQRALRHLVQSLRRPQQDRLSLFTPRGDILELPEGATVLDFAYGIHTDVGRQAGAAYVNGKPAVLQTVLHSGDVVEIQKDLSRKWPEPHWLDWVKTGKALEAIQIQLRRRPESKGRSLIDKELRQRGRKLEAYKARLVMLADEMECTLDEIYIAVARGNLVAHEIVDRLLFLPVPQRTIFHHIEPAEADAFRFPHWHSELVLSVDCCSPSPGDAIAGCHTDQGVELHRQDCPRLAASDRVIGLRWKARRVEARHVDFTIRAVNRKGLVYDLTKVIRRANVDIIYLEGRRQGEMDEIHFTLEVTNELELGYLLDTIRSLPGVNRVTVDGQESEAAMSDLRQYLAPPQPIILPYSPGKPVSGDGRFWGRREELHAIETHLAAENAVGLLLSGPRRIGKTSLLQQLRYAPMVRDRYRYVFVDLQSVAHSGAADVLRLIARRLANALDSERRVELPSGADFATAPLETFLDYLTAVSEAHRYSQKKILLALDEVGTLIDSLRANRLDFRIFYMLRSIMQHNNLVTIVLCTSDDIVRLLEQEGVFDLLNVTHGVQLDHLDDEAAQRLLQEPLRGQVYFEPDAITTLLHITDKHPYYLHILGTNLITMLNKERRRVVYESDIEALISRHMHLNGSEFKHLYVEEEAEQLVLKALCASPHASASAPFSTETVWRRLQEHGYRINFKEVMGALDRLTRARTLVRTGSSSGDDGYSIRIDLFRRWFAAHHALHRVADASE